MGSRRGREGCMSLHHALPPGLGYRPRFFSLRAAAGPGYQAAVQLMGETITRCAAPLQAEGSFRVRALGLIAVSLLYYERSEQGPPF